jgi:hypothetical protein
LISGAQVAKTAFEGTFHHLIALFSTVAGNAHAARGLATIFCNEIKDLETKPKVELGQKSFQVKHLAQALKVNCEAPVKPGNAQRPIAGHL